MAVTVKAEPANNAGKPPPPTGVPGWFLDRIVVEDLQTGLWHAFACGRCVRGWSSVTPATAFTSETFFANREGHPQNPLHPV